VPVVPVPRRRPLRGVGGGGVRKAPKYDAPTHEQPPGLFLCHQRNGHLCAGWVATHPMEESLAVRFAVARGELTGDDFDAVLDYTTDVPLHPSGQAAANHGRAHLHDPDERARAIMGKITRRRGTT
jgi:Family of unknown function (DUF6283)